MYQIIKKVIMSKQAQEEIKKKKLETQSKIEIYQEFLKSQGIESVRDSMK